METNSSPAFPHLTESRLNSEELFRGFFLHAFRDTVRLPDGQTATREYVRHPGAVMIIALQGEGDALRVVLERQFRYPIGQAMLEFPAGKLDPGETSLHCAQRELREETGYVARLWAKAGTLHPVIAYSTEFIDVWFAKDLTLGDRKLDDGEFLDVMEWSAPDLFEACLQGGVTDAKTLVGAFWLQAYLSGTMAPHWQVVDSEELR